MKPLGSVAAVIAAIREDASAEAEALDRQAQTEVERLRALEVGDVVTIPDRERRLTAARQESQTRLAQEDWEDTREAVADRERWMARAVELGRHQLADPGDVQGRRDRLAVLAREALSRLPGRVCEIAVPEADVALLGPEWRRAVADAADRDDVRVTAGSHEGGCIARTPDGRASFDNSYAARAQRFQAAWRSALAEVYEQALPGASTSADRVQGD
jgi:vacuolar-type H+-ATPase subunit E/Vma4